jgi:hypothetical protein
MKIKGILVFFALICTDESKLRAIESLRGISEFLNVRGDIFKNCQTLWGLVKFSLYFKRFSHECYTKKTEENSFKARNVSQVDIK